jgi:transposase
LDRDGTPGRIHQSGKMDAAVSRTGTRVVVLPKRWIVERTLAWMSHCRRLARDYERHARKAAAFVRVAMIRLMLRRLAASP